MNSPRARLESVRASLRDALAARVPQDAHPARRRLGGALLEDLGRRVVRGVVDRDELEALVVLVENAGRRRRAAKRSWFRARPSGR